MTVLIIGSGGHAKVVIDALRCAAPEREIRVTDGNESRRGKAILGLSIDTPEIPEAIKGCDVHVAIGSSEARQRLLDASIAKGGRALTIVHPDAAISPSAAVGEGSFVAARAVVAPDSRLGAGSIVNHAAVVDHDCVVGDYSHIGPGATLGGAAQIGARCEIGAGANILPGVSIGDDTVIGAGAVVVRPIEGGGAWAGIPARRLR